MCKVGLKAATTTSVYEVTSKSIVRREVVERMCEDVFQCGSAGVVRIAFPVWSFHHAHGGSTTRCGSSIAQNGWFAKQLQRLGFRSWLGVRDDFRNWLAL